MSIIKITVGKNESKTVPIIWNGASKQVETITLEALLDQPGSRLKIVGILLSKKGRLNLKTTVIHKASDTFSRTVVKGVLDGQASVELEGIVNIEKGAKNADADLKEEVILLSPSSHAVAIPRLDVYENEIQARHGASVGSVDEEQIFYLMSRGLEEKQAKHLITMGFLASQLSELPQKEADDISKTLGLENHLSNISNLWTSAN